MFLALKEIKDAKLRYVLLTAIIGLIAFVIFMIAGLAGGLSNGHKQAVEDWQASAIVLNKNANKIATASSLASGLDENVTGQDTAPVGIYSGAVTFKDQKENISFFGTRKDAFVVPELTSGRTFNNDYEIIISQNMADKLKLKIDDKVQVGNLTHKLKVVGIFKKTQYAIQPVAYTNIPTFTALKYGTAATAQPISAQLVNLIAVKGTPLAKIKLTQDAKNPLTKMSVNDFVLNLPGVQAESISLNAMVYILIVISAAVIAIFMYVLTLQKQNLFGILKAQGIPVKTIVNSIFAQSFLMSFVGVAIAFGLAALFGAFAPAAMPFMASYQTWLLDGILLVVVAVFGSIFSLPAVLKADPVVAIGG